MSESRHQAASIRLHAPWMYGFPSQPSYLYNGFLLLVPYILAMLLRNQEPTIWGTGLKGNY